MWAYALPIPLLFRPSWKLLGLLTVVAALLMLVIGLTAGQLAAVLFYGGVGLIVFVAIGALLVLVRQAFNRTKQRS